MNIAYILPGLATKGPVIVVKDLVEQMIKNGHECSVFYFDDINEVEFLCPVYRIKFGHRIDFEKFDVIHSHGLRPDCYILRHKPLRSKSRFVTTLHNYVIRDLTSKYNRLTAYIFGNLWMLSLLRHDKIVVLSKDAIKYYSRWFNVSRLSCVYNSRKVFKNEELSETEKAEIIGFKKSDFLIGVNAYLSSRKGIDLLIRVLPQLDGYRLFVVGEGKILQDLRELTKQYEVEDRVYFAGYHKNAYRYLPYYDIYAIPSRSEGFPLAMLEAAAFGVPVVCSDIQVFKEIFTDNEVSFFILENLSSLAEAIKNGTGNYDMAQRMHQKYLNCYSLEMFYKQYIEVYQTK